MKRQHWRWYVFCVVTFVVSFLLSAFIKMTYQPLAASQKVEWGPDIGSVYEDLPYGTGEANRFDLYLPADKGKDSYGLIVYLHAGGFTAGDKGGDKEILQWLCSKGYVAAGINYTLASETQPNANVATMSYEIRDSIPAVMAEAAARGYSLDRMAVAGGSAGGTLALLYAYRDAETSPLPVRCVFEAVGPASFTPEAWSIYGLDQSDEAAATFFSVLSGQAITPEMVGTSSFADAVREISPVQWIDEQAPPTLCAYGVHDKICPFATVLPLREALAQHGVPHDIFVFEHSGHALQNDNDQAARYQQKIEDYLATYLAE